MKQRPDKPTPNSFSSLFGKFDERCVDGEPLIPDASSGDGILRTDEECQAWAAKLGLVLREATDYEIFVDIDTEEAMERFRWVFPLFNKHFNMQPKYEERPSKQGLPHRHIVMVLARPLPLLTRIAIQACLQSDPLRELMSIVRVLRGETERVDIFFEDPV